MIAFLFTILPMQAFVFSVLSYEFADTDTRKAVSILMMIVSLALIFLHPWLMEAAL